MQTALYGKWEYVVRKKSATLMQYEINIRVDICWCFSLNWKSFFKNSWFNDAHNFKAFCVSFVKVLKVS